MGTRVFAYGWAKLARGSITEKLETRRNSTPDVFRIPAFQTFLDSEIENHYH